MDVPNKEKVNRKYEDGVRYLEASMGLELTISEKAIFRKIVEDSIRRNRESRVKFEERNEAIAIFLQDYYGVPHMSDGPQGMSYDWLFGRDDFIKKQGYDGYAEYWRKIQEEAHFP